MCKVPFDNLQPEEWMQAYVKWNLCRSFPRHEWMRIRFPGDSAMPQSQSCCRGWVYRRRDRCGETSGAARINRLVFLRNSLSEPFLCEVFVNPFHRQVTFT